MPWPRLASIAFLVATPAMAQVQPIPGDGDPRLQTIDYNPGQIVELRGAPGYQLMVELSPDEEIQSVALGDNTAWQVSVNKAGDRLFLKPAQSDTATNMTVVTSVRIYNFDLFSLLAPAADMPYTVQFRYPASLAQAANAQYPDAPTGDTSLNKYRTSGDRLLRPVSVTDDGQHIYVRWARNAPIPAVYTPDRFGKEMLVNGMMSADDVFVVDGTPPKLTFRIDNVIARAERVTGRRRR